MINQFHLDFIAIRLTVNRAELETAILLFASQTIDEIK